jgi:hypothetical protein
MCRAVCVWFETVRRLSELLRDDDKSSSSLEALSSEDTVRAKGQSSEVRTLESQAETTFESER